MSAENSIDFGSLTELETDKIVEAVRVISSYNNEIKQIRDSITDALERVAFELNADKASTARLKKYVKKAASIYGSDKMDELLDDNAYVDLIVGEVHKKELESA